MEQIGRYEVRGILGRGGYGTVYRVWDPLLEREVALKKLQPQWTADADVRRRFLAEAQAAANLHHPNIGEVYEPGEADGVPYFTMELIEGQTLDQLVSDRGPLPLAQAARILEGLCSAVDFLHRKGRVHRDIKAVNVIWEEADGTPPRAVLTDFGIARAFDDAQHTSPSMLIGTAEYMAPERWEGERGGPPSDIYALGILAYYLLAGHLPFTGTMPSLCTAHLQKEPPRLGEAGEARPDLPVLVCTAVHATLAKDPQQRPARATALSRALTEASAPRSEHTSAPTVPRLQRTERLDAGCPSVSVGAQKKEPHPLVAARGGQPPGNGGRNRVAENEGDSRHVGGKGWLWFLSPQTFIGAVVAGVVVVVIGLMVEQSLQSDNSPPTTGQVRVEATPSPGSLAQVADQQSGPSADKSTPQPTATPAPPPSPSPTPTPQPTPSPTPTPRPTDTPLGARLEVGQTWRTMDTELRLDDVSFAGPGRLFYSLTLVSRKERQIPVQLNGANLRATDQSNNGLEIRSYTCGSTTVLFPLSSIVFLLQKDKPERLCLATDAKFADPAFKELVLTVRDVLDITEARWRFPIR
jgi:serine/threonine-protein kinase